MRQGGRPKKRESEGGDLVGDRTLQMYREKQEIIDVGDHPITGRSVFMMTRGKLRHRIVEAGREGELGKMPHIEETILEISGMSDAGAQQATRIAMNVIAEGIDLTREEVLARLLKINPKHKKKKRSKKH